MKYLEMVRETLENFNGKTGLIPLMYFWGSGEKFGPIMLKWAEIPKQAHGQLLRQLHEGVGKPDSIFVQMEVRSLPMDLSKEENEKQNKELQEWKNEHGSFEGFPGIKDYAMFIGYDGKEFKTEMYPVEISEDDIRTFGERTELEKTMGGIFADNLKQAFHNVDAETFIRS